MRAWRPALAAALGMATPWGCVEIDPSYAESLSSSSTSMAPTTSDTTIAPTDDSTGSPPPFEGPNVAFVTSATVTADFGGLAAADAVCAQAAQNAGLPGTFVAWVSDDATDAITRLGSASGWLRTDGRVFARDRASLAAGQLAYPLLLTETGARVGGDGVEFVYTGTLGTGLRAPDTCGNWQLDTEEGRALFGFSDGGNGNWTGFALTSCAGTAHLYCLGVDVDEPVEPVPIPDARLVFATRGQLSADAGRTAADDLCASEAMAAGRSGTFLALMAVPGETLVERHDLGGTRWARADGIEVFSTATSPDQWTPVAEAAILFDATGQTAPTSGFWAGAVSPTQVATEDTTCNGWTDPAHPRYVSGLLYFAEWLPGLVEAPCDTARSVVCLEQ